MENVGQLFCHWFSYVDTLSLFGHLYIPIKCWIYQPIMAFLQMLYNCMVHQWCQGQQNWTIDATYTIVQFAIVCHDWWIWFNMACSGIKYTIKHLKKVNPISNILSKNLIFVHSVEKKACEDGFVSAIFLSWSNFFSWVSQFHTMSNIDMHWGIVSGNAIYQCLIVFILGATLTVPASAFIDFWCLLWKILILTGGIEGNIESHTEFFYALIIYLGAMWGFALTAIWVKAGGSRSRRVVRWQSEYRTMLKCGNNGFS